MHPPEDYRTRPIFHGIHPKSIANSNAGAAGVRGRLLRE